MGNLEPWASTVVVLFGDGVGSGVIVKFVGRAGDGAGLLFTCFRISTVHTAQKEPLTVVGISNIHTLWGKNIYLRVYEIKAGAAFVTGMFSTGWSFLIPSSRIGR